MACSKPPSLQPSFSQDMLEKGVSLGRHTQSQRSFHTPTNTAVCAGADDGDLFFRLNDTINCCLLFRTPLHYAAANCHFHCIETLVTTGAAVNETDDWGRTALHYAAASDVDRK